MIAQNAHLGKTQCAIIKAKDGVKSRLKFTLFFKQDYNGDFKLEQRFE
jgi:hypothetical protein